MDNLWIIYEYGWWFQPPSLEWSYFILPDNHCLGNIWKMGYCALVMPGPSMEQQWPHRRPNGGSRAHELFGITLMWIPLVITLWSGMSSDMDWNNWLWMVGLVAQIHWLWHVINFLQNPSVLSLYLPGRCEACMIRITHLIAGIHP